MSLPSDAEDTLLAVYGRYRRVRENPDRERERVGVPRFEPEPWELVFFSRNAAHFSTTTWRAGIAFRALWEDAAAAPHGAVIVAGQWTSTPTFDISGTVRHGIALMMGALGTTDYANEDGVSWRHLLRVGDCRRPLGVPKTPPHGSSIVLGVRSNFEANIHPLAPGIVPVGTVERSHWHGSPLSTRQLVPNRKNFSGDDFRRIAGVCVEHDDCLDHLELARACQDPVAP